MSDDWFFWRNKQEAEAHARIGYPPTRDEDVNPYMAALDPVPEFHEADDPPPRYNHHDGVTEGGHRWGWDCGMHYPVNNPRWQADRVSRFKRGSGRSTD